MSWLLVYIPNTLMVVQVLLVLLTDYRGHQSDCPHLHFWVKNWKKYTPDYLLRIRENTKNNARKVLKMCVCI